MKTMRIGSSIINLDATYGINCDKRRDGTIVRVGHPNIIMEYLVPDYFVPEVVAAAIQRGMNGKDDNFDLMTVLTEFAEVLE